MKKKTIFRAVILIALLATFAFADNDDLVEKKITLDASQLPAKIKRAAESELPNGKIVKVEKEIQGVDPGQYDVFVESDGKLYELEISPAGKVIEAKEKKNYGQSPSGKKWADHFNLDNCTFTSVGMNPLFILKPGHQVVLESNTEKVTITVLNETKMIGGIKTRVVEEREEVNGILAEVSLNFFAMCREHGDVFYFGEEVDDYENGKIVNHSGEWRADNEDSRAGIIMPGTILIGARHYQEIAPNAMDRAEIIDDNVTMKTPAGTFRHCVRVEETSGLHPDEVGYKTYAPGIGIIQDEDLLLTSFTKAGSKKVSMASLPSAVRNAIKKHAGGGKIIEVEKDMKKGNLVYEAEVIKNGKEIDILVSAEGKYLGTEEDDDDDADDEDENENENEDDDDDDDDDDD